MCYKEAWKWKREINFVLTKSMDLNLFWQLFSLNCERKMTWQIKDSSSSYFFSVIYVSLFRRNNHLRCNLFKFKSWPVGYLFVLEIDCRGGQPCRDKLKLYICPVGNALLCPVIIQPNKDSLFSFQEEALRYRDGIFTY